MKNPIVADGPKRLQRDEKFQARREVLLQSIKIKYAAELARAGLFRRIAIKWQIDREFSREWKKIAPSVHALHLCPSPSAGL